MRVANVARDGDRWIVTCEDLLTTKRGRPGSLEEHYFDAVFVCTGMFWEPVSPHFKGTACLSRETLVEDNALLSRGRTIQRTAIPLSLLQNSRQV